MLPEQSLRDGLTVRAFTPADERQARAAHELLAADDVDFCLGLDAVDSWAAWLEWVERLRAGRCTPPWVPETFLGGFVGSTLVGRVSVRHELNEQLAFVGGHVGYVVLPEHRRRGYAGDLMREALRIARDVGLARVLVTCSDDNVASVRTIERAGGVLQDVVVHPTAGPKRRYWIELADKLTDEVPAGAPPRTSPAQRRRASGDHPSVPDR